MVHLTLFDSPYQQAVADMILQFQRQLQEATTEQERAEIQLAIQSWTAAHGEPQRSTLPASRPSIQCSTPERRP